MHLRDQIAVRPKAARDWIPGVFGQCDVEGDMAERGEGIRGELAVALMINQVSDQAPGLAKESDAHRARGTDFNGRSVRRSPADGIGEEALDRRHNGVALHGIESAGHVNDPSAAIRADQEGRVAVRERARACGSGERHGDHGFIVDEMQGLREASGEGMVCLE